MKFPRFKLFSLLKRITPSVIICSFVVVISFAQPSTPPLSPNAKNDPARLVSPSTIVAPAKPKSVTPQVIPVQSMPTQAAAEIPASPAASVPPSTQQSLPGVTIAAPSTRLWNLQDADILSVISEVSQETGKNFVVDPRVTGKITLISSKPLRQSEVYRVFLSVLGTLGYSAIPSGNVIKIVPNMESAEQATKVATDTNTGRGDEVVVRVIPLENVSASQLMPVLRPLMPQWSNISVYTPGNVLILVGRADNLNRISEIIDDVDQASNSAVQLIPLKRANAVQVAAVLNNLLTSERASGDAPAVSIAVDERSNSVLLGGTKNARLRFRVLISQLDAPASAPAGNTEVIYLRYLEAKTFAPILGRIASNILGKSSGMPDVSASVTTTNTSTTGTAGASTSKDVSVNTTIIQAEPSTNSIIITAPPTLMKALKTIVAKLDIRPAQVLVEAIIAEIDESDLSNLGIQWGSRPQTDQVPSAGLPTSFPDYGAGIIGIMPHVQIQAVMSLLENQTGVDILSTPQIMVLDNQKATIEIGQMVPTQTGQYATSSSQQTATPFTTNDYKNVTLKLDVTPQINLGTAVRLKLALKNDTLQNPQNPGLTPIINTSKINNSVIINSEDVLVLGGLISNSDNQNVNKVPILGDIPVLGPLFQQKSSSKQKKNLMVFIKPIIMHTGDDSMLISEGKYDNIRRTQVNYTEDLSRIDSVKTPIMPPWKNKKDLPSPFGAQMS